MDTNTNFEEYKKYNKLIKLCPELTIDNFSFDKIQEYNQILFCDNCCNLHKIHKFISILFYYFEIIWNIIQNIVFHIFHYTAVPHT